MKNNRVRILAIKYAVYFLLFVLLYTLQTTRGALSLLGVRPNFLIPAAIAVAMHEGELVGGLLGLWAGTLCDLSSSSFYGLQSVILLVVSVATSLLVIHWMHCSARGAVLLTALAAALCLFARFYFEYGLWGYPGISRIVVEQTVPVLFYTVVFSPVLFWIIGKIGQFFESRIVG